MKKQEQPQNTADFIFQDVNLFYFDVGVRIKALTYTGFDLNQFEPSPHYPFLHQLPFDLHMGALARAMPDRASEQLLAKAHGQVVIELVRKEYGWSHGAKELDLSTENLSHFRTALKRYEDRYKRL